MFNELLTRPITESGFNSITPKFQNIKKKYICLNGVGIESFSGSNGGSDGSAITSASFSNGVGIVSAYDVANGLDKWAEFSTSNQINIKGYKRIWIDWSVTFVGGASSNYGVFYLDNTVFGGNYVSKDYYTLKTLQNGSFFERKLDYIDLASPNPNYNYYIGVAVFNTGASTFPNEATVNFYNIYLEG
jgi:hypothetical protein